jgi:hypothetical protein
LYAGGASLDVATAALAMRDALVPPTVNLDTPAPGCELRFVTGAPVAAEVRTVLVNARGFGGFNAALVLRPPSAPTRRRPPVLTDHHPHHYHHQDISDPEPPWTAKYRWGGFGTEKLDSPPYTSPVRARVSGGQLCPKRPEANPI